MSTKELLLEKLEKLPESLLKKVLDYISSLQSYQVKENVESYKLSESSLSKDWLKKEEDEAWQNL